MGSATAHRIGFSSNQHPERLHVVFEGAACADLHAIAKRLGIDPGRSVQIAMAILEVVSDPEFDCVLRNRHTREQRLLLLR